MKKLCECGCGQEVGVYSKTNSKINAKKGQLTRFIQCHHRSNKVNLPEKEIIEMYFYTHLSMNLIAKEFNCHPKTIKRILIENNIKIRTHSETRKLMFKEGKLKLSGFVKDAKEGKCKGKNNHFYGKHHTEETKRKILDTKKKLLKEGKIKIWNKGLTAKDDDRILAGEKNPMYGKIGAMNGKHHTEKAKEKISKTHKKLYLEGKIKRLNGKLNPMFGKKVSEEIKKKISDTHKQLFREGKSNSPILKRGEENPNWRGGNSFEPYSYDFNEAFKEGIKERDNYCCQLCNMIEEDLRLLKRYLVIHHINYDKKLSIHQNCITLCNKCHSLTNNNNRQHWKKFFQSLLSERYGHEFTEDQKIILDFMEGYDARNTNKSQ